MAVATTKFLPRSLIALLTPLVALGLEQLLWAVVRPQVWVLFYPAVFVSAAIGGRRLGMIATALSTFLVWWFLLPPVHSLSIEPRNLFAIAVFCATGVAFSFFHQRLARAMKAESAKQQLELDLRGLRKVQAELQRTNHELVEAHEFLENLLESSTEYSTIGKDLDRRVLAWNKGAARIYGYEASEVVGKSSDMLHAPEELQSGAVAALHQRALEEGRATGLFRRRRKDGTEFIARVVITRRNDTSGNAVGYLLVSHDVTDEQRMLGRQQFLAEVGAALQASLDYGSTVERIVKLAVEFVGEGCAIDVLEDIGKLKRMRVVHADPSKEGLANALQQIVPEHNHPIWRVLEQGQPLLFRDVSDDVLRYVAKNEEHLALLESLGVKSAIFVPLLLRNRIVAVITIVSCRSSRRYDAEDVHLAEELARRASLALDNARLYEVAQKAIHARDHIIGVVAHDLRSPLGTVITAASLLRLPNGEPERRSKAVASIERAANRMNRLIEDLLDVTRIEAGSLVIEAARVSAIQTVAEVVDTQRMVAAVASLELDFKLEQDLPAVWADCDRLLQVFENLIGNAVKFTLPHGRIVVGAESRGKELLFWVKDTGSGIDADHLPHVFDRFWQAEGAGRRGAGLGLPIVKGIVEAHGGRIWVESTPGLGSTFYFTIPTAAFQSCADDGANLGMETKNVVPR